MTQSGQQKPAFGSLFLEYWGFPGGASHKNLPANIRDVRDALNLCVCVWSSLGWEDPLEEGMASRSTVLAWRIPWTEEPGRVRVLALAIQVAAVPTQVSVGPYLMLQGLFGMRDKLQTHPRGKRLACNACSHSCFHGSMMKRSVKRR